MAEERRVDQQGDGEQRGPGGDDDGGAPANDDDGR